MSEYENCSTDLLHLLCLFKTVIWSGRLKTDKRKTVKTVTDILTGGAAGGCENVGGGGGGPLVKVGGPPPGPPGPP